MKIHRNHLLLLNYVFLAGLLVLALNDHLWKEAYGNWLTGKLSDFAGVLILPLFLAFVFNTRSRGVLVATIVLFTYWKSPLSQGLIEGINATGLFHYSRVVDYTDLLAFAVLPLSWAVLRRPERFAFRYKAPPAFARYAILPLTLLLFIATSEDDESFNIGPGIENCCLNSFLLDTFNTGQVYIPSAFTPDGDGINDLFRVIVDTGIVQIDTFIVRSLDNNDTLFFATDISRAQAAVTGWDGAERGVIEPMQVVYNVEVTATDGTSRTYFGFVCSIPCREPTGLPRPEGIDECRFPNQVDAAGFFDPAVSSEELLDCFD